MKQVIFVDCRVAVTGVGQTVRVLGRGWWYSARGGPRCAQLERMAEVLNVSVEKGCCCHLARCAACQGPGSGMLGQVAPSCRHRALTFCHLSCSECLLHLAPQHWQQQEKALAAGQLVARGNFLNIKTNNWGSSICFTTFNPIF